MLKRSVLALSCVVMWSASYNGHAAMLADSTEACQSLAQQDFSFTEDAPTQITSAKVLSPEGQRFPVCQVDGYVAPQVGFILQLPTSEWNGKFTEVGCGGWCGSINAEACADPVHRGYACIASDMGHKDASGGVLWALGNLQAQVDFGYRATHVAALAGKAIANRFYQKPATRSYFVGCSTGGYQGVTEAQRFPWDFDGIIAGAPDIDEGGANLRALWSARAILDSSGQSILTPSALEVLHKTALEHCDLDDGHKDGVIGNPVACHVDPRALICKSGETKNCLTIAQAEAARKLYEGASTSDGTRISTRGPYPGSELRWQEDFSSYGAVTEPYYRYGVSGSTDSPAWKYTDFNFDQDYRRNGLQSAYDNSNPDLRRFKAAGGKLIIYQGGNDTVDLPAPVIDYYETVERTMGGKAATQDFFRLFVVPGMNHCTGGDGAYAVDYLSYLEAWVERGMRPDQLIGSHVKESYLASHAPASIPPTMSEGDRIYYAAFDLKFPLDPAIPISFTRPIYPYPTFAKYSGHGDPNVAGSFTAVEPKQGDK
ncbi:MAG: tannase/feruloyl esterase family alpha/beta hydrolase [Steroidobacteraceae bacterium]